MNHHIGIDASDPNSAPRLVLVCTATPGSDCRKRPTDDRETWQYDDPDLVDGECWAAEWVDAAGWDDGVRADALDGTPWPRIPVTVHYDEGVVVAPTPARYEAPGEEAELRRLAEAATPGPWSLTDGDPAMNGQHWTIRRQGVAGIRVSGFTYGFNGDAAFIAAANPAAVLALLDRLAHMREARDNARAEVERLTGQIEAAKRIGLGHLGRPWASVLNDVIRALDGAES